MANWNSLKPLRLQRRILTFVIIGMVTFIILTPKHFLSKNSNSLDYNSKPFVTAKSGLKIRKEPNANSEIITTAKYNDEINIIEKDAKTDFVNGENGKWYKVEYKNQEGYAWSKFISE